MTSSGKQKVRILQVLYSLEYGGSERLASCLAYSIDRIKFEPLVLGLYGAGPIVEELTRHHISYYYFRYDRKFGRRSSLQFRLYHFLRKMRIDIIQVHGSYPFTRILLPAKLTNTKIISTIHSKHSLETVPRLRLMFRFGALFCNSIVVVSNALKEYTVKELGISSDKIRVIHNGVDLAKFSPAIEKSRVAGIPEKDASLVFVGVIGRLRKAKDHVGLLHAWARVMADVAGMKLFLIGDGHLRQELEQLVFELRIGNSVIFLGEREDLPQVISHMDLIVLPSKRESFPISILEAMAMKKPVIATAVGGIPEIIRHGYNGYLVPAHNPDALVDAILKFMKDRELFERMAVEGYKTVTERFSNRIVINKYQKLYAEICPV